MEEMDSRFSVFGLLAEFDWSFFFRLIQGRAFVVTVVQWRIDGQGDR